MRNVVLIGFMGTGKTAVGRRLAARLKKKFVDTDSAIEELTGKSISEIFRKDGQIRFRSEERLQVEKLSRLENLVISTGGGLVLAEENVQKLKEKGIIICLTADPEIICQRIKGKKERPVLQKGDIKENIHKLMKERSKAYDVAEFTVDTGEGSINESVDKIIQFLKENNRIHESGTN